MSVRGWVFVAMLLSMSVLVKPALKVAWPPEPDPAVSDDTGTVADGSDGSDIDVADNSASSSGASTAAQDDQAANLAAPPAQPGGHPQVVTSAAGTEPSVAPFARTDISSGSAEPAAEPQTDMSDITRSIVRDYAARRARALLLPSSVSTIVLTEPGDAKQSQQLAAGEAGAPDLVIAEAEDKLEAEHKRTAALADQLADAKSQLAAAQSAAEHLRGAVTSADARSDDWHRAAEQARSEAADTKESLSKVTAEAADAKDALTKAKTETVDAVAALAQARTDAAEFAARQKDTERTGALRIAELQQQLDAESARAVGLTQELQSVRAQLTDIDRQRAADAGERHALEATSRDLDAKLQDELKKNGALASELAKAQAAVRQLQEQARSSQAAMTPVRPGQPLRAKKLERAVPEARLEPTVPASPVVRQSAVDGSRGRGPKAGESKVTVEGGAGKTATGGAKGPATMADRVAGKSGHGRSGEVIAYIPVSPVQDEGFTSDDYSPYDTSDHTVYIDEYVTTPRSRSAARRSEIRVAKRSVEVR